MGKPGTWGNSETVQLEILPFEINPLEIKYSHILMFMMQKWIIKSSPEIRCQ